MVIYMAFKALTIVGMILVSLNLNWAYPLRSQYSDLSERLTMLGNNCVDSYGNFGICIFKWDCISQNGVMLSTCVDGFLFGACCALKESDQKGSGDESRIETKNHNTLSSYDLESLHSSIQDEISTPLEENLAQGLPKGSSNSKSTSFYTPENVFQGVAKKNINALVTSDTNNNKNNLNSFLNDTFVSEHSSPNSSYAKNVVNNTENIEKQIFNSFPKVQQDYSHVSYSPSPTIDYTTIYSENDSYFFTEQTTEKDVNGNYFSKNYISDKFLNSSNFQTNLHTKTNLPQSLLNSNFNGLRSDSQGFRNEFKVGTIEHPKLPTTSISHEFLEGTNIEPNATKNVSQLGASTISDGLSIQQEKEIKLPSEIKADHRGTNNAALKQYKGNSTAISFVKPLENMTLKQNVASTLNSYASLFPSSFQAVVNQLTSKETFSEKQSPPTIPSHYPFSTFKTDGNKNYDSSTEVNSIVSTSNQETTDMYQTVNINNYKNSLVVSNVEMQNAENRKPSSIQSYDFNMTHFESFLINMNEISNTVQNPNKSGHQKSSLANTQVTSPVYFSADIYKNANYTNDTQVISEGKNKIEKYDSNVENGFTYVSTYASSQEIEAGSSQSEPTDNQSTNLPDQRYGIKTEAVTLSMESQVEKNIQYSSIKIDKTKYGKPDANEHKSNNTNLNHRTSDKLLQLTSEISYTTLPLNNYNYSELNNQEPIKPTDITQQADYASEISSHDNATFQLMSLKSPAENKDQNKSLVTTPLTYVLFSTEYSSGSSSEMDWEKTQTTRIDVENDMENLLSTISTFNNFSTVLHGNENNFPVNEHFPTSLLEVQTQKFTEEKHPQENISDIKLDAFTENQNFTTVDPTNQAILEIAETVAVRVSSTESSANGSNQVFTEHSTDIQKISTEFTEIPVAVNSTFQTNTDGVQNSSTLHLDSNVNEVLENNYSQPSLTSHVFETTLINNGWDYKRDCGIRPLQPVGRIVGGQNTYLGKWPWQALVKEATWLGLFVKNKCGGVLISSKYVLTAAHCQPGFLASLLVVLGTHDLSSLKENTGPVIRNVKRMVVHRHYNPITFENDLAILEMDTELEFLPHVIPICLPHRDEDFSGEMAFVTGWGKLTHGGDVPNILQEVQVPIVTNKDCQRMFYQAGHHKAIQTNFVCAGYRNGGQDSCEGDSGGPLMVQRRDKRWVLVGTVSHGIGCADPNLPGVYMRMSSYRTWIDSIIKKD